MLQKRFAKAEEGDIIDGGKPYTLNSLDVDENCVQTSGRADRSGIGMVANQYMAPNKNQQRKPSIFLTDLILCFLARSIQRVDKIGAIRVHKGGSPPRQSTNQSAVMSRYPNMAGDATTMKH
jgi:hypothetical protein